MDDRIRELRRAGWSERRIAAELGVTRHRVRTALAGFRAPAPIRAATWVEEVELHIDRARLREDDPEQIDLGEVALDVAEWLDAHDDDKSWTAEHLANSLRLVIKGVREGSDPLVRIHARRTFRLRESPVPGWLQGGE
jgi:transcriptional regulator with XRE-family HTH domain